MSGRYVKERPEQESARRFVRHVFAYAVVTPVGTALLARFILERRGESLIGWGEWAGMLSFSLLFHVLPVYGLFSLLTYRQLLTRQVADQRYLKVIFYSVLTSISICMAYLLASLFVKQDMVSSMPILFGLSALWMLFTATAVGVAVGHVANLFLDRTAN